MTDTQPCTFCHESGVLPNGYACDDCSEVFYDYIYNAMINGLCPSVQKDCIVFKNHLGKKTGSTEVGDLFVEWVTDPNNPNMLHEIRLYRENATDKAEPDCLHTQKFSPALDVKHDGTHSRLKEIFDDFMRKDYYAN